MQNIVCFFLKSGNLKKKFYVIVKEQHPRTTNNQRRGQFCDTTTGIHQKYSLLVHVILLYARLDFLTEEMEVTQFIAKVLKNPKAFVVKTKTSSLVYLTTLKGYKIVAENIMRRNGLNNQSKPSLVCLHHPPPRWGKRFLKRPRRLSSEPRWPSSSRPPDRRQRRSSL